jgi:phage terminase large subunit
MNNLDIPIEINEIYIPHLNNLARTQIFYGGSGSGKSVFLSQRAIIDIMNGGRNYLVCRQVANTVRKSVFNEINKVISDWNIKGLFQINKTDGVITCKANGHQIIFIGLDDTEKVKSITPAKGVITDIWIEEATEIEEKSLKELYKRQRGGSDDIRKRMILSFNPILQSHFIYTSFFSTIGWADKQTEYNSEELTILKTWYIHNRFLTPDDIKDLTNETDSYYYNVYTLGNWGILGNVIFTNYSVQDLSEMTDQFVNLRCGGDFGFSSDPAALVKSHYDRKKKTIYVYGELYERGLTNDLLAEEVKALFGREVSTFDSSEPKSIEELRRLGCSVLAAKKGKDSVIHGIQWLQQQEIIIDKKCINTINEFQQYKWKEDKDGNAIRQPVDKNNHIIDAIRYAYENDSLANYVTILEDPFSAW